ARGNRLRAAVRRGTAGSDGRKRHRLADRVTAGDSAGAGARARAGAPVVTRSRHGGRAALAVLLALVSSGCWRLVPRTQEGAATPALAPVAPEVILRVNEAGVAWGNGDLGAEIQQALLTAALFRRVHYPVEPANPPELAIEVQALGRYEEAEAWGVVAIYA